MSGRIPTEERLALHPNRAAENADDARRGKRFFEYASDEQARAKRHQKEQAPK
jgi:hypothetical protein